jgi:hypothetical protein
VTDEPILEVQSHESGRNATVRLFENRIEREKPRSRNSFSKASQEVETIPVRSVTSVASKKDRSFTIVSVTTAGAVIDFRVFPHDAADVFRQELMYLMLEGKPSGRSYDGASGPDSASSSETSGVGTAGRAAAAIATGGISEAARFLRRKK